MLKLFRKKTTTDVIKALRGFESRELITADALEMFESILQISQLQVRDIMIPLSDMSVIKEDLPLKDVIQMIIESGHSRFPVIDDENKVVGILLAKDLLAFCAKKKDVFDIETIIRPATFVPKSKRLDTLLREFRTNRYHIAIVIDEYGATAGVITIEDILEQIVGEIEDEYDITESANIIKRSDNEFTVKALTPIDEFNEYFKTDFDESQFETIGGIVTKEFQHVPKPGETITIDNISFTVLHADHRRVRLLKVEG